MNDQEVKDCTIFRCIAGSHAYGTATPQSDRDERGVAIMKDPSYYIGMGLKSFEQKDAWGTGEDTVIYDLRKFFKLAADNNPNIIDLLFCPEDCILFADASWEKIKENRDAFLSKKCQYTYSGYAFAQLKRIKNARGYLLNPPKKNPERKDFNLPEQERFTTPEMIGAFQWVVADMLQASAQKFNISEESIKELNKSINYIGLVQGHLEEKHYEVIQKLTGASDAWMYSMQQEKAYTNAMNEWNAYQSWKTKRNAKRAVLEAKFGYDTKHAMQLVRLIRMGKEILEQGKVIVKRPDAEELLCIRNGGWTYDQVIEYAEHMEKEIEIAAQNSKLPRVSDRNKLDKLCSELIEQAVFR